jgi:signal transduction histidine kinase
MALPLVARGRALGALGVVSSDPARSIGRRELALGEELARRAALAVDNARLYREAREAIEVRDDFLSIASHELNTPLTSLQLMVESLAEDSHSPANLLPAAVPIICRQTYRLRCLVDDLLDVASLQQGPLRLRRQEVDLAQVVREVVQQFDEDLARAGCPIAVHAPASLAGHWDRARLAQVATNLLSNAIKFGSGKPIEITVEGPQGGARSAVVLHVEDHGMGIPPERLPHIFGRFERAVSPRNYGGLGLGLYIVHQVVRALGGTVQVQSALGLGSRFTVELPRHPPL